MNRTPVTSKTGMCGYAYDAATQTLEIAFSRPGQPEKVYQYNDFSPADWEAFQAAESKGSHFLRVIKPGFSCRKVEEEHAEDKEARKPFKTDKPTDVPF